MRKNLPLALAFTALLLIGAGCSIGGGPTVQIKPVTLEYWRSEDSASDFQPIIDAYRKVRPNVQVVYREVSPSDYERQLLEALAENRGPDLFSIPITWVGGWKNKIIPLPKETIIPTQIVNADKKIVTVNQKSSTMSILGMRNTFVEGVTRDLIMPVPADKAGVAPTDGIWGLPFSYDTLALYYNKTLLKSASVEKPPTSWRELQEQAAKLTILAADGSIKQSGAAIGGSKNVLYSPDILAVLMSQNGAILADSNGYARFQSYAGDTDGQAYPPGVMALIFYQGFANKGTASYSWNDAMPISLDAFVTGRTAFFFGYPSDMKRIRDRAPSLNFGVMPLPQVDPSKPKNIARYPVEVVSAKTDNPNEAWDFLQFASKQEQMTGWLTASKRPTAIRSLIAGQLTDPDIAPFAGQILTGRSWYKGVDWELAESAFYEMISARPTEKHPEHQFIVGRAAAKVNDTLR